MAQTHVIAIVLESGMARLGLGLGLGLRVEYKLVHILIGRDTEVQIW